MVYFSPLFADHDAGRRGADPRDVQGVGDYAAAPGRDQAPTLFRFVLTHGAGAAGEPAPEKRKVWVIARQHPGETMAEFFAEVSAHAILASSRVYFCALHSSAECRWAVMWRVHTDRSLC